MLTIPNQHYVGFKHSPGEALPLGFATPFGTDKAFESRKSTVDRWARPGRSSNNDKTQITPAKILNNELLEGFKISDSVRRGGWNGGNVVWRVVDPRGFELEISSNNFASIVDCTTIINGVIQGKCIWGREGAYNVLLPEASEPYKRATKNTAQKSIRISEKAVPVGTTVMFADDDRQYVYLGKFTAYTVYHPKELSSSSNRLKRSVKYVFGYVSDSEPPYPNRQTNYKYSFESGMRRVVEVVDRPLVDVDTAWILTDIRTILEKPTYGWCDVDVAVLFAGVTEIASTRYVSAADRASASFFLLAGQWYKYGYDKMTAYPVTITLDPFGFVYQRDGTTLWDRSSHEHIRHLFNAASDFYNVEVIDTNGNTTVVRA